MKYFFAIAILACSLKSSAQTTADIFKETNFKYYWMGVDFSHVKLVGEFADKSAAQVKKDFFPAWNELMLAEPEKFDIARMLRKDTVYSKIDMITAINESTSVENMKDNPVALSKMEIEQFVSQYNPEVKDGIGIVFVAELLDKPKQKGVFHVVIFNLSNKEVLLHSRCLGDAVGFGLRNYWAGAIYDIIKGVRSTGYKTWRSKYASKD